MIIGIECVPFPAVIHNTKSLPLIRTAGGVRLVKSRLAPRTISIPQHVTLQREKIVARQTMTAQSAQSLTLTPTLAGAYTTGAVHFNGATYLRRSSGLSGQGTVSKLVWCMWTKLSAANDGVFGDPDTFYIVQGGTGSGGSTYFNMNVSNNFSYFDTVNAGGPGQTITSGGWLGMICSVDLSGAGVAQIYQRDTDVQGYDASDVSGPASIPPTTNFYFGQDGFGVYITGDIADFRLWTGVSIDLTVENNRRKFVRSNGKPADPTLANTALGTPIVSFIGTAASPVSTFPVNGGSGGSFTLTGTLTAASSSPTD